MPPGWHLHARHAGNAARYADVVLAWNAIPAPAPVPCPSLALAVPLRPCLSEWQVVLNRIMRLSFARPAWLHSIAMSTVEAVRRQDSSFPSTPMHLQKAARVSCKASKSSNRDGAMAHVARGHRITAHQACSLPALVSTQHRTPCHDRHQQDAQVYMVSRPYGKGPSRNEGEGKVCRSSTRDQGRKGGFSHAHCRTLATFYSQNSFVWAI